MVVWKKVFFFFKIIQPFFLPLATFPKLMSYTINKNSSSPEASIAKDRNNGIYILSIRRDFFIVKPFLLPNSSWQEGLNHFKKETPEKTRT